MYTKGEVVWAKIKGFPWWPGIVAKVIEDKENTHGNMELLVNFIGENSHAQLSLDKVAKYQEKYGEYAKMKKKKLLSSIEIANKILSGETTFQAEHDKLQKDTFSNKKLPNTNSLANRKRTDSKSDDKTPSNDAQDESDLTSPHDTDINHLLFSPNENGKKSRAQEKKDSRKGSGMFVGRKSSQVEKSPALNKNTRARANSKKETEDYNDSEEPKLMKAFKLDGNTDEPQAQKPREYDLTTKPDTKSPLPFNNLDAAFTFAAAPVIENFNTKNSRKNSSALMNSSSNSNDLNKGKTAEFDVLREQIIERITDNGSPSVCGPILEKSIEDVISKINPETVSISEIVEQDLGRNIYTLIILLDELLSSNNGMEMESYLADVKDKLVNFNDIIKSRLVLHFVENVDHCSVWLKKLEQKREEKTALRVLAELNASQPLIVEKIETKDKKEKIDRISKKAVEEVENVALKQDDQRIEEEQSTSTLQINFEEYRFESEKKKAVLTERNMASTKINKPIYNAAAESSKLDSKQKSNASVNVVMNPTLRKKICLKMSKILQEKYSLEKNTSQDLTLKIETKIRNICPDMQAEYKNKILVVLKLLKNSLIDIQDITSDLNMDFYALQQKLDTYTKQNADAQMDANLEEDSPSLAKEIEQNSALIGIKINEFKRGENQGGIPQIA